MSEMKTLTILGKTYEITDQQARELIATLTKNLNNHGHSEYVSCKTYQALSEGQSALARNNINAPSVTEMNDKITEAVDGIFNTIPKAVNGSIVRSGDTITVELSLYDGGITTSVVTMNENGYPTTIVTDDVDLTLTWEGFDESTAVSESEETV